jgi:hypothetical protein
MDPDQAWQDLTAAALLGTERRAFAPPSASGPLGEVLGGLEARGPEKALLGTAAALALFRKAGRLPPLDPSPMIDPAEADDRPRCSVASDGHLAQMLSGTHAEALHEWLTALASAGRRPSEEAVPGLLDAGRAKSDLRPSVAAAVGPLGAWLARQNPEWAYAAGAGVAVEEPGDDAAVEALWQTGTLLQRSELLHRVRRLDPAKGRGLVASTWETDGFEARSAFVEAFEFGLSPDDHEFLEARLDDRRKEVRTAASGLLARQTGSDLVARMVGRVAPLLGFSEAATRAILGGLKGEPAAGVPAPPARPFKEVTLPEACDKAMVRDGIEPKPGRHGLGEKSWWLSEMVARVPPSAWSRAWGLPPGELAEAAVKSKWNDALYPALVEAAVLHRDFEWLDALLPYRKRAGKALDVFSLLNTLPGDRREAVCLRLIRTAEVQRRLGSGGDPLTEEQMTLLERVPAPWGDELSRLFLERLPLNLAEPSKYYYQIGGLLRAAARALPTAAALAAPLRRTGGDSRAHQYLFQEIDRHLEAFHALIQFRHDMIQELRA